MYDHMDQIVAIDDHNDTSATIQPIDNNHHSHIIHYEDTTVDGNEDCSTDNRVYVSSPINLPTQPLLNDSSQLTLSFRGQVYVFDSVPPQKVQAVLLLLGGCEAPSGSQCGEVPPQDQRGVSEYPKCSQSQRAASLVRFRQKRKERCFDKKVRYIVRQDVALRMQRNKGQFTSAKKVDTSDGWNADQEPEPDVQSETLCTHCGISSKSTPMMRKGPSGPRTLCNACGLFWANRGTLRDISKRNPERPLAQPEQVGEANNNNLECGIPISPHNNLITFTAENNNEAAAAMVSDQ